MAVAPSIFSALMLACTILIVLATPPDVLPTVPEHIFDVPGPLWAPLSQEQQATAAATAYQAPSVSAAIPESIYDVHGAVWTQLSQEEQVVSASPVTINPPVAHLPHTSLLAGYRRREPVMHPAGADAPVRGRPWVPHVQQVSDAWRRRLPAVEVFQATPVPPTAPLALLPKPWIVSQYEQPEPMRSFPPSWHPNALQPWLGASSQPIVHQFVFVFCAAAAIAAFAARSYELLHAELLGHASKAGEKTELELGNLLA